MVKCINNLPLSPVYLSFFIASITTDPFVFAGKVANKFKRLMGIRNASEGKQPATEVLKKQEEMFSSMEQQYEVARTATHTMRGVGLGFGSFQR